MKDGGPRFPKRRWMFEGQKIMYFQYITLHNDLFRCQQGTLPPYNSHGGRILLCISTSVRIPPLAYVFKRFSKIKFVKKNIRRSIFKAKIVGTWNVQSYSNDLFFFYSRTRVDFPWTLALVHRAKRLQVIYFLSHTCQSAYLFLGNNKISVSTVNILTGSHTGLAIVQGKRRRDMWCILSSQNKLT